MKYAVTLVAICLMGAVGVQAAMKIEVARQPDVDFSAYQSFGIRAMTDVPPEHPLGEEGTLFKQVSEAARDALLARGMTYVEGDTPDVWLTFFGLSNEDLTIEGTTRKLGGVTWVGDPGAHSSRTVIEGTLIIQVVDSETEERVWSGWASMESADRDKLRARAGKATKKILDVFPRE